MILEMASICSHVQPLEWPQVAASGRLTSSHGNFSTFSAATCSHSSGRQRPPAFGFSSAATCSTCSHSSGRQWPPAYSFHRQPLAATCSHLQPIEWPQVAARASGRKCKWPPEQVAASGRKWPQVAAFAKIKFVPFCTLSENSHPHGTSN